MLRQRTPLHAPAERACLPWLVKSHFGDKTHWLFSRKGEGVSVTVGGPVTVNTYQGIHRFALLGVGAACLPYYMVAPDLSDGRLTVVCQNCEIPALPLYVVYPGQRHLTLRTRAFIDFAVQQCQEP